MTCEQFLEMLLDFVGEELDAPVLVAFEHHRSGCGSCGGHVDTYRTTIFLSRALPKCQEALPPGVEDRLRAALGMGPGERG